LIIIVVNVVCDHWAMTVTIKSFLSHLILCTPISVYNAYTNGRYL